MRLIRGKSIYSVPVPGTGDNKRAERTRDRDRGNGNGQALTSNTSAENPSKDAKLNLQTWSACLICSDEQSWSLDTVDNGSSMLGRVEDGGGMGGEMERGDEDRRDENGGASEEGFGVLERMLVLASANALAEVEAPTALAGERQAPGPQGNANR